MCGIRFIAFLSAEPHARQRPAVAQHMQHRGGRQTQCSGAVGEHSRDQHAVPRARRCFVRQYRANRIETRFHVLRDKPYRRRTHPRRSRLRSVAAGAPLRRPCVSRRSVPAVRHDRMRIPSRSHACCTVSPIAVRPNTSVSIPRKPASSASSTVQAPFQRAAVEQDGLLRQPLRGAPGCDRNARSYGCRYTPRQRAIETFRGLARNRRACARLQLEQTRQRIAAGNTARGIQRHHRRPVVAFRPGKPRLQAASLAQSIQHRASVAHAQHHAQFADRPLQHRRVRPRGGVVHPPRPAPPAAPPARHHRDPSPRWSARVPGRNRNIAPPAEWPCRRAPATARSPGRCP